MHAAMALGEIADPNTIEPLITTLKDQNEDIREVVAWALWKIGEPAIKPLIHALKDPNRKVRMAAAADLGLIGDFRAVESLKKELTLNS